MIEPPNTVDDLIVFATRFSFYGHNDDPHDVHAEQTLPNHNAWAVRFHGRRVSIAGAISMEPTPSSRSEAYLKSHTFSRDAAIAMAQRIARAFREYPYQNQIPLWKTVP